MAKGKYGEWITKEGLTRVQGWARDGLSDKDIAGNIGISVETFYQWKKKYPEFSEALREGKDIPDRKVENALYERCFNQTVKVMKTFKVKESGYDANGKRWEREDLKEAYDEVVVPADVRAQQFWLSNRKPDAWRDKKDVELSGAVDLGSIISQARGRADGQE